MLKTSAHRYTLGGQSAHILRRLIHLSSLLILWVYYQYGVQIAQFFGISVTQLVWLCLSILLALEALRLSRGWTVFGQRDYERNRISALVWGGVGMAFVVLFAPGKQFAVPIICSYAIADPLLGELRRASLSKVLIVCGGLISVAIVWLLSWLWLGTMWWLVFLMAPVTVAAEWPCLNWIDDNATMQLIPLAVILFISTLM